MIPTAKVGPALKAFLNFSIQVNQAVLLEGPAGVGKTEIVQEVARENKLECLVLNLSILEPTDLTGLPVTVGARLNTPSPYYCLQLKKAFSSWTKSIVVIRACRIPPATHHAEAPEQLRSPRRTAHHRRLQS